MIKFKVKFDKVTDVVDFTKEIDSLECDADLSSGRYLVNAKSIMGIFVLDVSKPVDLIIYSDDIELKDKFNRWRV